MKGLILLVICLASSARGQQFPSEFWHEGKIVLETGDTLTGSIKYDLTNDLVQFSQNNKLESFSARKMTFFEIFDQTSRRYRQFYAIPYVTSGAYKAPVLFELLAEGKMTLLCRESVEYRSYSNSFYSYGMYSRLVLVYHYFMLKEDGNIEPFVGKRNDLLALMDPHSEKVQKYIKVNKLDVTERPEFIQIVNYYNSLYK